MNADLILFLYFLFAFLSLVYSWIRSRRKILHPHFMFTVMLILYISDFLVRGYEDQNLRYISPNDIYYYQYIILFILSLIVFLTSLISSKRLENQFQYLHLERIRNTGVRARRLILLIATLLLALEIWKRFGSVGWSIDEVITQSFSARGQRDWDISAYSGNFLFSLVTILLPLASVAFAFLFSIEKGVMRLFTLTLFGFVLLILITNGSRTPVALSFAAIAIFLMQRPGWQGLVKRCTVVALTCVFMVNSFSIMLNYRSTGYLEKVYYNKSDSLFFAYHQDDSYYRAIYAYAHADHSNESWDPVLFIKTIAANPIPRVFWPEKPILTQEFYGRYKLDYVTNSFLGEIVAMAGVNLSIIFSIIIGCGIYLIIFNAQRFLLAPMGIAVYLIIALYTYMCLRSLLNVTHFIYLPIFAVIVSYLLKNFHTRIRLKNAGHISLRERQP